MRSQGREVEGEGRRIVTTPTWKNKSYHRRKFDRAIVQVKEDIPEGNAECQTL